MTRRPSRLVGLAIAVLLTLAGLPFLGSLGASAHVPDVSATCSTLSVSLTKYDASGTNHVTVTIDTHEVAKTGFTKRFVKDYPLDRTTAHTYTVDVRAHDDADGHEGWTKTFTGTTTPCTEGSPQHQPVTLCHAHPADKPDGWVVITVDDDAVVHQSTHATEHDGDIIPPFTWTDADGTHEFEGKNWDEGAESWGVDGKVIYANGCQLPDEQLRDCTVDDIDFTRNADLTVATVTLKKAAKHKVRCAVSLNSYMTEGATWETSGTQKLLDHDSVTLTGEQPTKTLKVNRSDCFGQNDLYLGSKKYDGTDGALPHYPDSVTPEHLLSWWNGGQACTTGPHATVTVDCTANALVVHLSNTGTADATFKTSVAGVAQADTTVAPGARATVTIGNRVDGTTYRVLVTSGDSTVLDKDVTMTCAAPTGTITVECLPGGGATVSGTYTGPASTHWRVQVNGKTVAADFKSDGTWSAHVAKGTVTLQHKVSKHTWETVATAKVDCPQPQLVVECQPDGTGTVTGKFNAALGAHWRLIDVGTKAVIDDSISGGTFTATGIANGTTVGLQAKVGNDWTTVATKKIECPQPAAPVVRWANSCIAGNGVLAVTVDVKSADTIVDRYDVMVGTTLFNSVSLPAAGATTATVNVPLVEDQSVTVTVKKHSDRATVATTSVKADCRTTPPTNTPDPQVDKFANPASGSHVWPGQQITYTVRLANTGTAPLTSAQAVDTLPAHVTLIQGSISGGGTASADGSTVTWSGIDLAAGASKSFTYAVTVDSSAPHAAALVNRVVFLGKQATTTHTVTRGALTIAKSVAAANGQPVKFGDTLTYTMVVTADGPQQGVIVTDYIPGYDPARRSSGTTTYVTDSAKCLGVGTCVASYDASTHRLTWHLGDMEAGTTRTVSFQVVINSPEVNGEGVPAVSILNAATVSSTTVPSTPSNEVRTDPTVVGGVKIGPTPKPSTSVAAGRLPSTGAGFPVGTALLLAGGLIALGAAAVTASRFVPTWRRRH